VRKKIKNKKIKKTDFFPTISVSTPFGFTHLFSDMFVMNKALLYAVFASERQSNVLFINKVSTFATHFNTLFWFSDIFRQKGFIIHSQWRSQEFCLGESGFFFFFLNEKKIKLNRN
jgi:hypothetical protein